MSNFIIAHVELYVIISSNSETTASNHSLIFPLYKGKGDRSYIGSYRPISVCPCLARF